MKAWTKVELSDIDHYGPCDDFDFQCGIEIHAWEHYDEECDIDHENWANYNENWEVVVIVFGVIQGDRAEIRVQYEKEDYENYKSNLLIQKAIKEAKQIVSQQLDFYFSE